jgi:membrane protease YdiL (CAAX protease family)
MKRAGEIFRALGAILWTGVFAVVFTALTSGIWGGLLTLNLKTSPAIPWSVAGMGLVLLVVTTFLNGNWGLARSKPARRVLLRARGVSVEGFTWSMIAGMFALAALAGLWVVLIQTFKMAGNSSDFSRLPSLTVISALAMAAISGAVSEEAGFRGYFQGTLERYLPGWLAIAIAAIVMLPEHASTQGFAWPTIIFYLLVDSMLGITALLTRSILPGIVIHAVGLAMFFGFIWPNDKMRPSIWAHGADPWFFIHAGQAALFGLLSIIAYRKLAQVSRDRSALAMDASQIPSPMPMKSAVVSRGGRSSLTRSATSRSI